MNNNNPSKIDELYKRYLALAHRWVKIHDEAKKHNFIEIEKQANEIISIIVEEKNRLIRNPKKFSEVELDSVDLYLRQTELNTTELEKDLDIK